MKLEFYNCPKSDEISSVKLPETPEFVKYVPDFDEIKKYAAEYGEYQNILIIAHGGSLTSFYGYYNALKFQAKKKCYFLSTVDPDYIYELKQELKPADTLVISISKSGENTTHLEMTMQFLDYPLIIVTGKSSPLRSAAEKLKLPVALHPPIGGRFTGLTEVALLPAGIAGLDAEGLYKGAKKFYELYDKENLAFKAASVFWQLEQKGFVDVFMPFYSHNLFPMSALIVQLCHESFGKSGRGQTYLSSEAPESQHHTNQRFFGGPKNIAGFFVGSDGFNHPTINIFPPAVHSVQVKGRHLADINKIPLEKALEFELKATLEDARINSIPCAHLSISGFTAQEVGQFCAFWQLYAVYSSVLRNVNPFDQPQVENSKNISFDKRLAFKGLL
jgi:glucose-6-phosphate isomerase